MQSCLHVFCLPLYRKLECAPGRAKLETVHRGTGSEHLGVTLKDSNGKKSVLVRIGGNPFNDPETEGYRVGKPSALCLCTGDQATSPDSVPPKEKCRVISDP